MAMDKKDKQSKERNEFPMWGLVLGVVSIALAFLSYGLYTLLPHSEQGWKTTSLWIQIIFFVALAIGLFVYFLHRIIEYFKGFRNKENRDS